MSVCVFVNLRVYASVCVCFLSFSLERVLLSHCNLQNKFSTNKLHSLPINQSINLFAFWEFTSFWNHFWSESFVLFCFVFTLHIQELQHGKYCLLYCSNGLSKEKLRVSFLSVYAFVCSIYKHVLVQVTARGQHCVSSFISLYWF